MKFALLIPVYLVFGFLRSVCSQPEAWSHSELQWYTIRTEHFDIHYHNNPYNRIEPRFTGPERTARLVAKIAEEIYGPVTRLYNHRPKRIHFVIRDTDDYSNGGAYYYDNKIEIWASNLDFDLRGTHNWLRNVVAHEFTHMVSIQAMMKLSQNVPGIYLQYIGYEKERRQDVLRGFPNVVVSYPVAGVHLPVWFAEGTAQYQLRTFDYEFWDSHRDMVLRSRALTGQLLSLSQMSTFGKNSIGNESAYNSGYAFVSYLCQRFGENILEEITSQSRKPMAGFESAIKKATGQDLQTLYTEWTHHITERYASSTSLIRQNMQEGHVIEPEATGTFFPSFSKDGSRLVFISNRGNDYLSQTALWLHEFSTGKNSLLVEKVDGAPSWSSDGRLLLYSKNLPNNKYNSQYSDLYVYDVTTRKEFRLTRALRTFSPVMSKDGSFIVAVVNVDGTNNLIKLSGLPSHPSLLPEAYDEKTFARKTLTLEWLTSFADGRQIHKLVLSGDDQSIFFDTSTDDGRDIAKVNIDGSGFSLLLNARYDERSPALSQDGTHLYYSSDETGIHNIYRMNLSTGEKQLVTNTVGGAFYPAVDGSGRIAFSLYTGVGYVLSCIDSPIGVPQELAAYTVDNPNLRTVPQDSLLATPYPTRWATYPKSYADYPPPHYDSTRLYRNAFLDFAILPIVRIDYGTLKPGFYTYSGDVLAKSSFFGGAMFNLTDFDRDLFAIYEYSGFGPTLFMELYNATRSKTFRDDADPMNQIKYESVIKNSFELREIDAGMDFSWLSPRDLRFTFAHSEYFVKISGKEFRNYTFQRIFAGGIKYFYGNDFSLEWKHSTLRPSIDLDINPRGGRKIDLKYGLNFDNLISGFAFNTSTGATEELYENGTHHRFEARMTEFLKMPIKDHTLEIGLQTGAVLTKVDSFYNFFAGGLPGLRGYSFYSIEGSRMAILTATYRFPIWRMIDGHFLHVYLDKIFGGFYFGYGNAWSDKTAWAQRKNFKKDIGMELRMELYSFFVYPTRLTFNAVYGLDEFKSQGPIVSTLDPNGNVVRRNQEVSNGKEWRYYLTVLFGFSLFD